MVGHVLMVLTSNDALGNSGEKTGYWLEEFAEPYYAFRDGGAEVTVASPKGGQPPVDPRSLEDSAQTDATRRLAEDADAQRQLASTRPLLTMHGGDFDALFYPGGHGPLWDLVDDESSINLIEEMYAADKPVGAVCHGPAVFRHARAQDGEPLVAGKRVTGFSNAEEAAVGLTDVVPFSIEDAFTESGAQYSRGEDWAPFVQVDGHLVTGQNPASSRATADSLLELLKSDL